MAAIHKQKFGQYLEFQTTQRHVQDSSEMRNPQKKLHNSNKTCFFTNPLDQIVFTGTTKLHLQFYIKSLAVKCMIKSEQGVKFNQLNTLCTSVCLTRCRVGLHHILLAHYDPTYRSLPRSYQTLVFHLGVSDLSNTHYLY